MYLDDSMCGLQALAAAGAAAASSASAAAAGSTNDSTSGGAEGASTAAAAATPAAAAAAAPAAAARGITPAQQEGLTTLRRILTNVSQQPPDAKFFRLSAKSSKLQQLLAQPLLRAAVLAAGFRPVLEEGTVSDPQGQMVLIASDSSGGGVQAAARVLLQLLDGGAGEGVPEVADGAPVV
jgi:hypothetical protein